MRELNTFESHYVNGGASMGVALWEFTKSLAAPGTGVITAIPIMANTFAMIVRFEDHSSISNSVFSSMRTSMITAGMGLCGLALGSTSGVIATKILEGTWNMVTGTK